MKRVFEEVVSLMVSWRWWWWLILRGGFQCRAGGHEYILVERHSGRSGQSCKATVFAERNLQCYGFFCIHTFLRFAGSV